MSRYLIIGLFLISCRSTKQISSTTYDLEKHSYLLILTKKNQNNPSSYEVIGDGTGFFVREKGKLFLISANHVFTGNDPIRVSKGKITPDLMTFYYQIKGQENLAFQNIYLDSIQKSSPPMYYRKYADILAYPINLQKGAQVNTIEAFFNDQCIPQRGDSVFFWGFPSDKANINQSLKNYIIDKKPAMKYSGIFLDSDSIHFISTPTVGYGASGAPVFIKQINNKSEKIFFLGVLSSASDVNNTSHIVRYEELFRKLH